MYINAWLDKHRVIPNPLEMRFVCLTIKNSAVQIGCNVAIVSMPSSKSRNLQLEHFVRPLL